MQSGSQYTVGRQRSRVEMIERTHVDGLERQAGRFVEDKVDKEGAKEVAAGKDEAIGVAFQFLPLQALLVARYDWFYGL